MKVKLLKKRTWHYIQNPKDYEITCDKCNGTNIEWSEFEHMIWCYDCKIDTKGTEGVFGGPIPVELAGILGMSFDRWDMINKVRQVYDNEKQEYLPVINKFWAQGEIPNV
ncbi:MAG: hypothetical protein Q7R33_08195 [Nitrosarchaeum sp.]|nr:hypothetical protein [Nitrosarchaeum sp.]